MQPTRQKLTAPLLPATKRFCNNAEQTPSQTTRYQFRQHANLNISHRDLQQPKLPGCRLLPIRRMASFARLASLFGLLALFSVPFAAAQSSQAAEEWGLFNQILLIGIAVGIVVFGIMFYAIIRYREKPQQQQGAN
jgi:hypothetical protein